ncbi:hypothetical protein COCNU_13G002000 [Cocos nucifera]|uniref:Uncharacterized protein n=1 Tax=Cocos nucifera TaxID=13894 RepID=A0A8K0ISP5_COCNU|nr:hypothetical protein COCNU_13G002000 [Cocos nucifera]
MDLRGVPLEALAFRYSATVAVSLWAWFAILAAALGLWRIRAALPLPPKHRGPLRSRSRLGSGADLAVTELQR